MPDIDLEPKHYRVKRGRRFYRYTSSLPFTIGAWLCGAWAVVGGWLAAMHLPSTLTWAWIPIAVAPFCALFLIALRRLGEETVEAPRVPLRSRFRRPKRERRIRPQDRQWQMYWED